MIYSDISVISGVGEVRRKQLERLGIRTVYDMLRFFPRRFEDRSQIKKVFELQDSETASVTVIPRGTMAVSFIRKGMTVYRQAFADDSGIIEGVWFNNPYIKTAFKAGTAYTLYGKVSAKYRKKEIASPIFEPAGKGSSTERIVPIYPLTASLTHKSVLQIMERCLDAVKGELPEALPDFIREKYHLAAMPFSMKNIHFPKDFESHELARRRFVFEEFFLLQTGLRMLRGRRGKQAPLPVRGADPLKFASRLPFELTAAQKRVIGEIQGDLPGKTPMNRLVQGDVGCGKTIVAAYALLCAVESGFQAVLMAPTDILARQHLKSLCALFPELEIGLVSGKQAKGERLRTMEKIENGSTNIIIGTHALIQENVRFHSLGLAVTDEQHRFGVQQRGILAKKGNNPHVLVMSATPIPRTLTLILYGDLDISVIDSLPPGRQRIDTFAVGSDKRDRAYGFVGKEIEKGRQAYVVCPMIEENPSLDVKNVESLYNELKTKYFSNFRAAYLHGKMKPAEKEEIMSAFERGEISILISTTVIEVGVNVPNASVMVIENAERFGLSQLHQLRGRVGRGSDKAYCILFSDNASRVTAQRLDIMKQTCDGFKISEKDLELRGPGDFFGTRQHGLPELRIANIFSDMEVLRQAGAAAEELLRRDPELKDFPILKEHIGDMFRTAEQLGARN